MNMAEFMDGKRELWMHGIGDFVRLEEGSHGDIRLGLGKRESIAAGMGDDAKDVIRRLLKANADDLLEQFADMIVDARSQELSHRLNSKPMPAVTLADFGFASEWPLPGLPVSLRINDHAEQCGCGIEIDVGLNWAGRWSGRVGGLRWMEAHRDDDLRDVLRELLNSCAPTIIDALIEGVIEVERERLKARATATRRAD